MLDVINPVSLTAWKVKGTGNLSGYATCNQSYDTDILESEWKGQFISPRRMQ